MSASQIVPAPYYIGVDLESSSGCLLKGGIIEIGMAVSDSRGYVIDFFNKFCNPFIGPTKGLYEWDKEASEVHKIPRSTVDCSISLEDALKEFDAWIARFPGHILLCHHTSFDIAMLRLAYAHCDMKDPKSFWSPIDVPSAAYFTAGAGIKMPDSREMNAYTGMVNLGSHQAMHDALNILNNFHATRKELLENRKNTTLQSAIHGTI